MSMEESIQTSKIYSVAGRAHSGVGLIRQRPFRAPHYTASLPALIGGGSDTILPGEMSLAHNGVLFIDEFCEAPKKMIEALRAPMEDRRVVISRLKSKVEYPASFMLVAATNPCPCGWYGEGDRCTCAPSRREAYLGRLSGPLLDRVDLHLWLKSVDPGKLVRGAVSETSEQVRARVITAREIQAARLKDEPVRVNAEMDNRMLRLYCPLDARCQDYLEKVMTRMGLSARACTRIIRLARTIADLEGAESILVTHLAEAAGYRFLDRQHVFDL
jgi:magnesium chelatase family protein